MSYKKGLSVRVKGDLFKKLRQRRRSSMIWRRRTDDDVRRHLIIGQQNGKPGLLESDGQAGSRRTDGVATVVRV
jgi:hypothetical protein